MLDLDALTKRVSGSLGTSAPAEGTPTDPDAATEGAEAAPTLAEAGDRAIAAYRHGDGESLAQAILDIVHRGR